MLPTLMLSALLLPQPLPVQEDPGTPVREKTTRAAQKKPKASVSKPKRQVVYKTVGDVKLRLHVFEPKDHRSSDRRGAILFFFGGGWISGNPSQFYPHCEYLAKRGMVAMSAEYRVRSKHKTTPFECVADGKSAVRFVRRHAKELGIDPRRIAAGGGSAGGHVAAAVATVPGLDDKKDDPRVSCRPAALVLFNPVYDNGPQGWGHSRVKDRFREISPMHNISKTMPPAIVFLGTKDKLIPVRSAEQFRDRMRAAGVRSELMLFPGKSHGFFNHRGGKNVDYTTTVQAMEKFLRATRVL